MMSSWQCCLFGTFSAIANYESPGFEVGLFNIWPKIRPFFNCNIFPPRSQWGVNKNESVLKPGMAFPPIAVLLTFDTFRMLPVGLGFRAPPAMIDNGSMGIFMSFVKFAPEMKKKSIQTYLVWIFWFHRKRYRFYHPRSGVVKWCFCGTFFFI